MLETITRKFENKHTEYRIQHLAEKEVTNLSFQINDYLMHCDVPIDKINSPILRKRFRNELDKNNICDFYLTEYKINNCSVIVSESIHARWTSGENAYRCFQRGKVEIHILSDHPSMLKYMTTRLNASIYKFENPEPCQTCGIDKSR